MAPGEVHVWRACLDAGGEELDVYAGTLSPEERVRAGRFISDLHRNRFVAGRGILRTLLARYLDQAPAAVRIAYGPHGKPFLPEDSGLFFNVSHSDAVALFAFARDEVGVDIERIDSRIDIDPLAARYFAPAEIAAMGSDRASRVSSFYEIWTKKESFLKATGDGLGRELRAFEAPVGHDGPVREPGFGGGGWYVKLLTAPEGYAAALTLHGVNAFAVREQGFRL